MHVQDPYDQEGDRLRDRRTIPLFFGDRTARYTIAIPMLISSLLAPVLWQLSAAAFLPFAVLGLLVTTRLMAIPHNTPRSDKLTFLYWNVWIIYLILLPLFATWTRNFPDIQMLRPYIRL